MTTIDSQRPPNIIKTIRMLRDVRGLTYDEALVKAVDEYRLRNWDVPKSIMELYNRRK